MRSLTALLMIALATSGFAASDVYVNAFVHASTFPSERVQRVVGGMQAGRALDDMVAAGIIRSPHDCLPEHRSICYDVIHRASPDGLVIEEWGEWLDSTTDAIGRAAYVDAQVEAAVQRGFNLLTDDEIDASLIRR